jgi:tripeptide aminopeptidase
VPPAVLDLFLELAALPTPPGRERPVADRVLAYLREAGLEPEEDDTAPTTGSDSGNVYVRLEPTAPGDPLFLCAHMDTVQPLAAIEPVVGEDGVVRNAAGTILGADNKASLAAMLVGARRLVDERRPHAGLELVLTTKEEVGLQGAKAFDATRLAARTGFVYDQAGPVGEVVLGAPHQRLVEVAFHGRSAHAGIAPEEGRSAIVAAARAIADLRLGRLDAETTANVGLIEGGSARNVVPERCWFVGDLRSHDERKLADLVQELQETVAFAATAGDCRAETQLSEVSRGYRFRREDEPVRLAAAALRRAGFEPRYGRTGGGADANVFNARGLACANLSSGMADIHGPDEHIAVADLEALVELTLALVDEARAA